MSKEIELTLFGLVLAAVIGAGAWYTTHLLAAGKAEATAALVTADERVQAQAAATTAAWQQRLTEAENTHAAELNQLAADAIGPTTVSVRKLTIAAAGGVSPNSAAPAGVSAAGPGGVIQPGVVCQSSAQLQRSADEAQRADRVTADYRLLYDAWPPPQ